MKLKSPDKLPENKKEDVPFVASKGELTPEHYAIRIQGEFLRANPALAEKWSTEDGGETARGLFRKFFNDNKELCIQLFNDSARKNDLFEMIRRVVEAKESQRV